MVFAVFTQRVNVRAVASTFSLDCGLPRARRSLLSFFVVSFLLCAPPFSSVSALYHSFLHAHFSGPWTPGDRHIALVGHLPCSFFYDLEVYYSMRTAAAFPALFLPAHDRWASAYPPTAYIAGPLYHASMFHPLSGPVPIDLSGGRVGIQFLSISLLPFSGVRQLALSTRAASGGMPKYLWCLPDKELASVF